MSEEILEAGLHVARAKTDRRVRAQLAPPYLTEEGLVLIDRREGGDRRAQKTAPASQGKQPATSDLVLQRMKQLAELYGYRPLQPPAQNDCLKEISAADNWYQPVTRKWEDAA